MIVKGKRAHQFFAYGGAHGFLVVMAFQIGGREGWLIALPLMALVSLYAWVATLRRHRMVGDMPTSLVASAAQGYVELFGVAESHPDSKTLAHLSKRPCCWFRYEIEERDHEHNWRTVDEGESAASFLLRDSSGHCTVDPEGAEVHCANKQSWDEGDGRYTEWWIEAGDPLYALGEFSTRNFAPGLEETREDVGQLLAEWKQDKAELARRFDLNGDGRVDDDEWQLARAAAKREIEREHAPLHALPSVDMLMRPRDGRLYILSNEEPERVKSTLGWWAWGHLAILFGSLTALVFVFF